MPAKTDKTRPTTDYARESLFNILQNQLDLQGIEVLDLFSGSGAIGYEFLSRGAAKVVFVENHSPCINFIKNTLRDFGIESKAEVQKADVYSFVRKLAPKSFDIIFADPPYASDAMLQLPDLVFVSNILKEDGQLIIEHDDRHNFENHSNFASLRKYGQSIFSFFEPDKE